MIKSDYGLDYVAIIIYKVRVITNYSFGPFDSSLIDDIWDKGCGIAKIYYVILKTVCLINT